MPRTARTSYGAARDFADDDGRGRSARVAAGACAPSISCCSRATALRGCAKSSSPRSRAGSKRAAASASCAGSATERRASALSQPVGRAARGAAAFRLDERGRLDQPRTTCRCCAPDSGRIGRRDEAAARPRRKRSARVDGSAPRFLWKFAATERRCAARADHESACPASRRTRNSRPIAPARNYWQQRHNNEQRRETIQQYLRNLLLPQSTRLIPMPVVAAILGAFVLIVGPGDWFVLGWLRRRRWTWLTFPVVAAAFTALTVAAAEHYLGSEDHRSALVITDVGRGGRVLRESRLELLFAARDKEAATELRQTLAVPTAIHDANAAYSSESRGQRSRRSTTANSRARRAAPATPAMDAAGEPARSRFELAADRLRHSLGCGQRARNSLAQPRSRDAGSRVERARAGFRYPRLPPRAGRAKCSARRR